MKYGLDPEVDAFEVGSLLRQLTEVWGLTDAKEPGNLLLPILRSALLKREGGSLQMTPAEASNTETAHDRLEKVFGTDRYQPLGWLRTGLKRCDAIGRVEDVTGTRIGTGFLVRASDFFPHRAAKEVLFLTNAHVISPASKPFPGAIRFDVARVVFEATSKTYGVKSLVWSSPQGRTRRDLRYPPRHRRRNRDLSVETVARSLRSREKTARLCYWVSARRRTFRFTSRQLLARYERQGSALPDTYRAGQFRQSGVRREVLEFDRAAPCRRHEPAALERLWNL